jgi:hypothetical protein
MDARLGNYLKGMTERDRRQMDAAIVSHPMSPVTRAPGPHLIHDSKSDVNVTRLQPRTRQAILAEQIRGGWQQTLEGVVLTGSWLTEGGFRKADYQRFALPFSYSWGKRLIRIARSPRVLNPLNRAVLPDKADALHQIVLPSDRLFNLAVSEGVVNNQALVIDIKQFRQSFIEPGRPGRRRMTVVYECSPELNKSARETLDAFAVAAGRLANARFPKISVRGPRKMKELMPG